MYKKILCAMLSLSSSLSIAQEAIHYQVQADLYSEPLSIDAFTDGWKDPNFKSGKNAFAHGRMALGVKQGAWDFDWVWTYDYVLKFSPDTALLYYQIQNDQQINPDYLYQLKLKAQHVDTVGARTAYNWQLTPNWVLTTGATALIGRHYIDGQAQATGQTTQQQELVDRVSWLNGSINYSYDDPKLKEEKMGWDAQTNKGYGFSLDFALRGKIKEVWQVYLNVQDALGYLYWQDAPYTRYQIAYDQNNRPRFDIQGKFDKDQTYTQKLPYKIYTEFNYVPVALPWSVGVSSISNQYISLWQLNTYFEKGLKWGFHVEPQTQSIGLSAQHQNFGLKYMTDDLNTNQAKRMSAQMYMQYFW